MCEKFRFSFSSRCDDFFAEVKGGNFMPPSGLRVARRPSGCRVKLLVGKLSKWARDPHKVLQVKSIFKVWRACGWYQAILLWWNIPYRHMCTIFAIDDCPPITLHAKLPRSCFSELLTSTIKHCLHVYFHSHMFMLNAILSAVAVYFV